MDKQAVVKKIVRFFIPEKCMFCETIITDDICPNCLKLANVYLFSQQGLIIDSTYKKFSHLDNCICFYDYKNIVKNAIIKAKYKNCASFLNQFLLLIPIDLKQFMQENKIDIIISSPAHKSKFYDNEFDLPMEMAKLISKQTNVEYSNKIVVKQKLTQKQHTLTREKRKTNLTNAFCVKQDIKDKNILIVDDILTTGHTLDEIAKNLKKSKANKVIGMTFAYNKH